MSIEQKRLGDVATYINGYPFKPEDRGTIGLPIIRIQDLTGNAYDLGFYNGKYPDRIEINDEDVLISWSASLGVYIWDRGKALLNQHIFKVVFDKADVDKKYFVYAVQHKLKEMESKTHGATMKHIVKKDFDNTLIPFPSLEQQREVADNLRENARIKSILYTNGDELAEVVFSILEKILACDLSEFVDEKKEDFLIKKDEYTIIGEIKGVTSNIKSEHISQVDVHYHGYLDKLAEESKCENVYQVLIMNPFRNKPLSERDPVHDTQILLAERNGCLIIETVTLLKLYEKLIAGEIDVTTCEKLFTEKSGILKESDF